MAGVFANVSPMSVTVNELYVCEMDEMRGPKKETPTKTW